MLQFVKRGQIQTLAHIPPTRTLLELLRNDLGLTGTKEGCRSGDCGACTVVLARPNEQGQLSYRAVNSCIQLAHATQGQALWTVEDLSHPSAPHPVQQALVKHHASQCGFCTPGFAMSLFALYQTRMAAKGTSSDTLPAVTREETLHALSGNLCRCTGYRPILDAAQSMLAEPTHTVDEPKIDQLLKRIAQSEQAIGPLFSSNIGSSAYIQPTRLAGLLQARAAHPKAQLVAGCTDVGLWITKQYQTPPQVLDLTRTQELLKVGLEPPPSGGNATSGPWTSNGAAVNLPAAFGALVTTRPVLATFASRFAGLPVRNSGTLGGNVANGSPIGDSMPLLIALGAWVRLMRANPNVSETGAPGISRELPLDQFYTGYRQTVLRADEVLTHILVPPAGRALIPGIAPQTLTGEFLRAYKISKRFEDDISAVSLGLRVVLREGVVTEASIGVGGVAATPARAVQASKALLNQPWTEATVQQAATVLQAEFSPISDMRASAAYRRATLAALLHRAWVESTGVVHTNLEHSSLAALTGDLA